MCATTKAQILAAALALLVRVRQLSRALSPTHDKLGDRARATNPITRPQQEYPMTNETLANPADTPTTNPYIAPELDADGKAWVAYEIESAIKVAQVFANAGAQVQTNAKTPRAAPTEEDLAQMRKERRMLLVRDHAKNVANGVAASMSGAQAPVVAKAIWAQAEALADTDPLNAFEA